ncbi:sugar ABC transporter substrate-binding protein [candidate division KSB1 bacterium]|nr:sugar ABC transporter substrate-binding protein [candidate division KSB1 bacterium]
MKKLIGLFSLSLLLIVIIFGNCQRSEKTQFEGPTIGLVLKTLNHPFFIDMQKGAEDAANQLKVNLIVQAAERELDVEKQMQIIENLIQRKVDAICVTPSGSRELVPVILKANQAGIPILTMDTRVDSATLANAGGEVITYIGSDNFEGGRIAGKYLSEKLNGKANVAILEGIPGHETGDARIRGFHKAISDFPEINVVASQTANWERDQGFNVFQNIIQSHPEVEALFACSDLMALGAIEAIAAAGKTGKIIVVGFDAINDGRDAIREDKMAASVAQHPYDMGRLSVEHAHKVLNGETVPDYLPVKIGLVTKDNVDE